MKFIFKIKIKKWHTEKQYVDAWKKGSAIIQKSKGALGTTLCQNRQGTTDQRPVACSLRSPPPNFDHAQKYTPSKNRRWTLSTGQ